MKKRKSKFKIIRWIIIGIVLLTMLYLLISIYKLNILPFKISFIITLFILVLNFIAVILLFVKLKITRFLGILLSIVLVLMSLIAGSYINDTNKFLDKSFNNNVIETSTYNVVTLSDSNYSSLEDLTNKSLGYLKDSEDSINKLNSMITTDSKEYEDLYELYNDLLNKNIEAMLIDEAYLDILSDIHRDLDESIKVISSFDLTTEIAKKEEGKKENNLKPINIFISGSDSRSNNISNKSRSDVNMIVTVNPNTHEVLLTSIPRDYYVNVHGKTGLKDKLTHAGIYGLEISTKTVEDLFNIEIDYSIKLGFNALTEIVDLVGGIEVYSDTAFRSSHIKTWNVQKGINYMDGKKALAYSRERYAYRSGDRHRIQNQQQVLEATMKKILSNKNILLKYDELLVSLGNLYRTDIPKDIITLYVKEQLNSMPTWKFTSQWVDGKGAMLPTYTAPKSKRSVLLPYEDDVKEATQKINSTLSKN